MRTLKRLMWTGFLLGSVGLTFAQDSRKIVEEYVLKETFEVAVTKVKERLRVSIDSKKVGENELFRLQNSGDLVIDRKQQVITFTTRSTNELIPPREIRIRVEPPPSPKYQASSSLPPLPRPNYEVVPLVSSGFRVEGIPVSKSSISANQLDNNLAVAAGLNAAMNIPAPPQSRLTDEERGQFAQISKTLDAQVAAALHNFSVSEAGVQIGTSQIERGLRQIAERELEKRARLLTPTHVPDGFAGEIVKNSLEPVYQALREGSPVRFSDAIGTLQAGLSFNQERGIAERTLEQELTKYTNDQGIIRIFKYAKPPEEAFQTKVYSENGSIVRASFNQVMGVEEVTGFACAELEQSPGCAQAFERFNELKALHYVADALFQNTPGQATRLMNALLKDVREGAIFTSGFFAESKEAIHDFVDGVVGLFSAPPEAIIALGYAMVVHPYSLIAKEWDNLKKEAIEFIEGSTEVRGKKIGRVVTTFGLQLVGAGVTERVIQSSSRLLALGAGRGLAETATATMSKAPGLPNNWKFNEQTQKFITTRIENYHGQNLDELWTMAKKHEAVVNAVGQKIVTGSHATLIETRALPKLITDQYGVTRPPTLADAFPEKAHWRNTMADHRLGQRSEGTLHAVAGGGEDAARFACQEAGLDRSDAMIFQRTTTYKNALDLRDPVTFGKLEKLMTKEGYPSFTKNIVESPEYFDSQPLASALRNLGFDGVIVDKGTYPVSGRFLK